MKENQKKLGRLFKGLLALAVANAPAVSAQDDEKNIFELSPFEVSGGDENNPYMLKDSLGGTRLRAPTKDIAAAITVLSKDFLLDTGSTDNDSLLVYVPSTEVSGPSGSFLGNGDGANVNGNASISNSTRVRGLDQADNTRGYFGTEIPWDSYNVSRVDLQRGPNSILFGLGSPGGIVNATLEGAAFANSNEIGNRLDEHGSVRWTATFNRELIEDELAIRISALEDQTKYKQDPAYKDDSRIYGAIRWEPSFLNGNDGVRSTLKANFETGEINATLSNLTPPLDYVSPYFNEPSFRDDAGNLITINPLVGIPQDAGSAADFPYYGPYHVGSSNGVNTAFTGAGVQGDTHMKRVYGHLLSYPPETELVNPPGAISASPQLRGIQGYGAYLNDNGEFRSLGPYKEFSMTNPSWFDFYNNTIDGPNNWTNREFDSYNVAWEQTFMDNTLGFELVYDSQEVMNDNVRSSNPGRQGLHIDIMENFIDGTANPNLGRLFYATNAAGSGIDYRASKTDTARATAFYTLDFAKITQSDGWLSKLFGKNTFTALYEERTEFSDIRNHGLQTQTITQPQQALTVTDSFRPYSDVRSHASLYYFGPSFSGSASSPDGAGGVGIKDRLIIRDSTINVWDPVAGGQGIYNAPIRTINQGLVSSPLARDYNIARLGESDIKSTAFVWQGSWLGDTVLPLVGLRRDEVENRNFQAGTDADGFADTTFGSYLLPDELDSAVLGDTETYGLVVKAPGFIKDNIGGMDVRFFWGKAENFKPEAGRTDYFGESIQNPSGVTDEYGVYLESADGKYSFRATKYKTDGENVTLPGGVSAQSFGNYINWVSHHAHRTATGGNGPRFGFASDGRPVQMRPAGLGSVIDPETGAQSYSQAEKDARVAETDEYLADYFSKPVDPRVLDAMNIENYFTQVPPYGAPLGAPKWSGIATTGGTFSEGYEFEFSASPIKGLNIMVNASKTSARRAGLAGSFDNVIAEFDRLTSGPAGKLRFWSANDPDDPDHGNGSPGRSQEVANLQWARGWYNQMRQGIDFYKALEESDVPELRPWSVNTVVSYQFQDGKYQGLRLGGSARYQDARTLGFPVIPRPNAAAGLWTYDVSKPHKGDSLTNYDLFASYRWKVGQNKNLTTRLNVRNVFASDELIPVTVQPDGTPASYRIAPPRTITLTNTFSF